MSSEQVIVLASPVIFERCLRTRRTAASTWATVGSEPALAPRAAERPQGTFATSAVNVCISL
jgi:hypothetical protein